MSIDGEFLVSGSNDCTVRLWNLPRGEIIKVIESGISAIYSVAMAPDNKLIAAGNL